MKNTDELEVLIKKISQILPGVHDQLLNYNTNINTVLTLTENLDEKINRLEHSLNEFIFAFKEYEGETNLSINELSNDSNRMKGHIEKIKEDIRRIDEKLHEVFNKVYQYQFIEKELDEEKKRLTEARTIAFSLKSKMTVLLSIAFIFGFLIEIIFNKTSMITKLIALF